MLNILKLHLKQHSALLIAIVVSMFLHSLFLISQQIKLPNNAFQQHTIEARLVNVTPVKTEPQANAKSENKPITTPPPEDKQSATPKAPPLRDLNLTKEPLEQTATVVAEVVNEVSEATETNTDGIVEFPSEDTSSDTVDNPDSAEDYFSENFTEPTPQKIYRYIESEFEVKRGNDQSPAGTTVIIFKIEESGAYKINSNTEANGLASLFFNTLTQTSEGSITEFGLQPSFYQYQYGNDERKLQSAQFAWSDGVIELNTSKGKETISLPAGTQDLLSFMYQFMFVPPLDNMQLSITNGKNLKHYVYEFIAEEIISTQLGELNTLRILYRGEKEAKTELWLATDHQHIPVKIRKTEKNGEVIEQTISHLSTAMPE